MEDGSKLGFECFRLGAKSPDIPICRRYLYLSKREVTRVLLIGFIHTFCLV